MYSKLFQNYCKMAKKVYVMLHYWNPPLFDSNNLILEAKWTPNGSNMGPKMVQNGSKMSSKWVQDGHPAGSTILPPFLTPNWPLLAPQIAPKWSPNGSRKAQNWIKNGCQKSTLIFIDFFWVFWLKIGSKIDDFLMIFERAHDCSQHAKIFKKPSKTNGFWWFF